MSNTRRRRLRARPLLVAVGTISLASIPACFGVNGVGVHHDGGGGTGGVGGGGDELDLAIPTPPPDMKPSNSD
jgi:hypothetical protein